MRGGLCALRARGLLIYLVWAASGGGKAGPVMGLRPLLGPPCIPPEAPRWGFPSSYIPRGLRGTCFGSFLASLGDLPARRAMPACDFALNERPGSPGCLYEAPEMAVHCLGKVHWGSRSCDFTGIKPGLTFERWLLCPAGTGAFLFLFSWPPAAGRRNFRGKLLRQNFKRK